MNDKQLGTMWTGILAIVCFSLFVADEFRWGRVSVGRALSGLVLFQVVVTIVAAITVGLTCTFADRKPKYEQKDN